MESNKKSYYNILGVNKKISYNELQKKYKKYLKNSKKNRESFGDELYLIENKAYKKLLNIKKRKEKNDYKILGVKSNISYKDLNKKYKKNKELSGNKIQKNKNQAYKNILNIKKRELDNYYKILGVDPKISNKDLLKKYEKYLVKTQMNRFNEEGDESFKEKNEAYKKILKIKNNPSKKNKGVLNNNKVINLGTIFKNNNKNKGVLNNNNRVINLGTIFKNNNKKVNRKKVCKILGKLDNQKLEERLKGICKKIHKNSNKNSNTNSNTSSNSNTNNINNLTANLKKNELVTEKDILKADDADQILLVDKIIFMRKLRAIFEYIKENKVKFKLPNFDEKKERENLIKKFNLYSNNN